MKSIIDVHRLLGTASDRADLLDLVDQEVEKARAEGDRLGIGEWLVGRAILTGGGLADDTEALAILSVWSLPPETVGLPEPSCLDDLIESSDASSLVHALVGLSARLGARGVKVGGLVSDLAFRVENLLENIYDSTERSPHKRLSVAAQRLTAAARQVSQTIETLSRSTPATSKTAALDVLKAVHNLRPLCMAAERPFLGEVEALLGSGFRRFAAACEANDAEQIVRLGAEIQDHSSQVKEDTRGRGNSVIWNGTTRPVAQRLSELAELARSSTEEATAPDLRLGSHLLKVDLGVERAILIRDVLRNDGFGRATSVHVDTLTSPDINCELSEPSQGFAVDGRSEQPVTFRLELSQARRSFDVRLRWTCRTLGGRPYEKTETLRVEQQITLPDWERLRRDPPYSLNPITDPGRLIGRADLIERLALNVESGTSTFLWGPKRVGKTSVAQVLANRLDRTGNARAALFRLGELRPLSDVEIGHRFLERLTADLYVPGWTLPPVTELGSGLGAIIPHLERVRAHQREKRFLVIVDEFDDLSPSLYLGERGLNFMTALRSLSETGLTFFFCGSERMRIIYNRHQQLLNKWADVYLDSLESLEDRAALVTVPVEGSIEYEVAALSEIVDLCGGNPFYSNLICAKLFEKCVLARQTFVSLLDVREVLAQGVGRLGDSNFAHLWEDNPELEGTARDRQAAENCIALCGATLLGGSFRNPDDLVEACTALGLSAAEEVTRQEMAGAVARLQRRRVFVTVDAGLRLTIAPPILRDWLRDNSKLTPLSRWREYAVRRGEAQAGAVMIEAGDSSFVIPEEQLIEVSQRLNYVGKQRDVAELRRWLRQFDDEARIPLAFKLVKRLSERGFITSGARLVALEEAEQAIRDLPRDARCGPWREVAGRVENLCITFVDGAMKSGGSVARELANRLRPARRGPLAEVGVWLKGHLKGPSTLVLVDEFAGTGESICRGIERAVAANLSPAWDSFLETGRVTCVVLYSLPEARRLLAERFPNIRLLTPRILGDDLRAFSPSADLFSTPEELNYTRDFIEEIGAELVGEMPLGFGNLGTLIAFDSSIPNNTLPIFWSGGQAKGRKWTPLLPRA